MDAPARDIAADESVSRPSRGGGTPAPFLHEPLEYRTKRATAHLTLLAFEAGWTARIGYEILVGAGEAYDDGTSVDDAEDLDLKETREAAIAQGAQRLMGVLKPLFEEGARVLVDSLQRREAEKLHGWAEERLRLSIQTIADNATPTPEPASPEPGDERGAAPSTPGAVPGESEEVSPDASSPVSQAPAGGKAAPDPLRTATPPAADFERSLAEEIPDFLRRKSA